MLKRLRNFVKNIVPKDDPVYNYLNGFRTRARNPYRETGFHGDGYLTELIFHCIGKSEQFIETGSSVGSSLVHVAKSFPSIALYSCEPDKEAFEFTSGKVAPFPNVTLLKKTSPEFLYAIEAANPGMTARETTFWLDSHGMGFKWPLRAEVKNATTDFQKGYLFIDDFVVPGKPQFGYSTYDEQICSFEYIKDSLDGTKEYTIYYPSYDSASGLYDPLRGWILIDFGHTAPLILPDSLSKNVSVHSYRKPS
ncbi:MAG: hypothetical protein PHV99_01680 [Candidatus Pacebacteria bacterium]|nr:hypothetical protein [Candidatus Paceibacterota bacterium]